MIFLILFSFLYPYARGKISVLPSDSVVYKFYYRPGLQRLIFSFYKINGNNVVFNYSIKNENRNILYYGNINPEIGVRTVTGANLRIYYAQPAGYEYIDLKSLPVDTFLKYIEIKFKNNSTTVTDSLYYFINLEYDFPDGENIQYITKTPDVQKISFTNTKDEDTIFLYSRKGDYALLSFEILNDDSILVYKKSSFPFENTLKLTKFTPNHFQSKLGETEYLIVDLNPVLMKGNSYKTYIILKTLNPPASGSRTYYIAIFYATKYQRW